MERRWLKTKTGVALSITTILGLFGLLSTLYGFEINDLTGDIVCEGTYLNPCISEFEVRNPNAYVVDIYSSDQVKLDFSPEIKDYALFVPDGRCTATGSCACDLDNGERIGFEDWRCVDFTNKTKPREDKVYNFRFPAYSTTKFKLVGIKSDPTDTVKWTFGTNEEELDPIWLGVKGESIGSNMEYSRTSDTICNGGRCTRTLYSGIRNVQENGEWKRIEDARSLKDKGFEVVYLEQDPSLDLEVIDFNYTSIQLRLDSDQKYRDQDIPLRTLSMNESNSSQLLKQREQQIRIPNEVRDIDRKQYVLINYDFGDIIEYGFNSTTIQLIENDSENLADLATAFIGTGGGFYTGFIKFNLTSIPDNSIIKNASLNLYFNGSVGDISFGTEFSGNLTVCRIINQTWIEDNGVSSIGGMNGTDNSIFTNIDNETWNSLSQDVGVSIYDMISSEIVSGNNTITFRISEDDFSSCTPLISRNVKDNDGNVFIGKVGDFADALRWINKEHGDTTLRPYLNITYSVINGIKFVDPTPQDSDSTTNTTIYINYSINGQTTMDQIIHNWNETNYTILNESSILYLGMNNNSGLGENDTHLVDISNHSNNFTSEGSIVNVTGKYGQSFQFDGVNDYITRPYDSDFDFDTGGFTIEAWVNSNPMPQTGSSSGSDEQRIDTGNNDAEECIDDTTMYLTSSDLEMPDEETGGACDPTGDDEQLIGMRFITMDIPSGSTITAANITFQADESDSSTVNLYFYGQDTDDADIFTTTNGDISNRELTSNFVGWEGIEAWVTNTDYTTPDLSSVIQEIIDRPGWNTGQDIVIIVNGTSGSRVAESYNGETANAPILRVSYTQSTPGFENSTILSRYDDDQGYKIWMNGTGNILFGIDDDSTFNPDDLIYTDTGYDDNTWYHVTGVRNSTGIYLFVDGELISSDTTISATGTLSSDSADLSIGKDEPDDQYYWNGSIDEVIVWNYGKNTEQVIQGYFSNLNKVNSTDWYLSVNQSRNPSLGLDTGTYTYYGCVVDQIGNVNCTEERTLDITTPPTTEPEINFTFPTLPTGTQTTNSSVNINVSIIEDTNISNIKLNWNGTNYTFYDVNIHDQKELRLFMNLDNRSSLGESDNLVIDLSNYSNNGVPTGSAIPTTTARYGGAYDFAGTASDYIDLGEPDSLKLYNFTISVWFRRTGAGTTGSSGTGGINDCVPIVTKGVGEADGDNRDANYVLCITDGTDVLAADFEDMVDGSNHPITGTTTISNDIWYHGAVTYNGSTWYLYLNGIEEATSVEGVSARGDSIQDNAIGTMLNSVGTASGGWEGQIDEVKIYQGVLTNREIAEVYFSSLTKFNQTTWNLYLNQSHNSTSDLLEGVYTYYACASDNEGSENCTETRNIEKVTEVDTTSPLVTIVSPLNYTYTNTTVMFNLSLNEDGETALYTLNGGTTNYSMTQLTSTTFNATNSTLTEGSYTVNFYVNDTSGNRNDTEQITFSVKFVTPNITYTDRTEVDGTQLNQSSVFIEVEFQDDDFSNLTYYLYNSSDLVASETNSLYHSFDLNKYKQVINNSDLSLDSDTSSVAHSLFNDTLFMIHNSDCQLDETDITGTLIRSITLSGFEDCEGIGFVNVSGNDTWFAVSEERRANVTLIRINNTISSITLGDSNTINMDTGIGNLGNDGLEGVTYDNLRGVYYGVREGSTADMEVYLINFSDSPVTSQLFVAEDNLNGTWGTTMTDISDIYYDNNTDTLFLVSHESLVIANVYLNGTVISNLSVNHMAQPEGITFDQMRGKDLYVVGEADFLSTWRSDNNFTANHNFTGINNGTYQYNVTIYDVHNNFNSTEERTIILGTLQLEPNSCIYSTGNWNVNCTHNCSITSDITIDGSDILFYGDGIFTVNGANITGWDDIQIVDACKVVVSNNGVIF